MCCFARFPGTTATLCIRFLVALVLSVPFISSFRIALVALVVVCFRALKILCEISVCFSRWVL